jgi:hypothetical protein
MSTFANSLKRLYDKGFITVVYLDSLLTVNKITQEEYDFIINQ